MADVGLRERVGGCRRPVDRLAAAQPGPRDRAEAVGVGEVVGGRQRVPLLWRGGPPSAVGDIGERDRPRHCIVDVGDVAGGVARRRFDSAEGIGLGGPDGDQGADVLLGERVVDLVCAEDHFAAPQPSPGDGPDAVDIGEIGDGAEGFSLSGSGGAAQRACEIGEEHRPVHRVLDRSDIDQQSVAGGRQIDPAVGRTAVVLNTKKDRSDAGP